MVSYSNNIMVTYSSVVFSLVMLLGGVYLLGELIQTIWMSLCVKQKWLECCVYFIRFLCFVHKMDFAQQHNEFHILFTMEFPKGMKYRELKSTVLYVFWGVVYCILVLYDTIIWFWSWSISLLLLNA